MKWSILLFLIFFNLFLCFPATKKNWMPSIQEDWIWNKTMDLGLDKPNYGISPFLELNGYIKNNKQYHFSSNNSFAVDESTWRVLPFFGKGNLNFKKIGDEITFQNTEGEILWKKPYNSYPRSSFDGKLILFISGDQNKVFLGDANGNPVGVEFIEGRYLTQYQFAEDSSVVLIFAGGEVFYLSSKGEIIWKKNFEEPNSINFLKSVCISPKKSEKQTIGIHLLQNDKDIIQIINQEGEIQYTYSLEKIFPYTLPMACQTDGKIAIHHLDKISLLSKSGSIINQYPKKYSNSVYSAISTAWDGWAWEREGSLEFIDNQGILLRKKKLGEDAKPWKLIPSISDNSLYLETDNEIWRFYSIE